MDSGDEKYDGILGQMLKDHKGYEGFFTNVFGFLRRRTDFFQHSKTGEEIVAKVGKQEFDAYMKDKATKEKLEKERQEKQEREKREKAAAAPTPAPTPAQAPPEPPKKVGPEPPAEPKKEEDKPAPGKLMPNKGNGSATETYYWTQTLEEVFFQIPVEREVNKKNLKVDLGITHCRIASVDGKKVYVDDDWCDKIHVDESSWVLVDEEKGKVLQVSLLKWKNSMNWWDCLIKSEPKIDTQKVNPEPGKLSDLDGESRTTVEKMMFDMQQKQMGKPTSDELEKREKLKDFMKAHPELDFSKAKFS